ncbi:hypothetical protein WR25_12350 [Diploscapter pachys]|uniref:UV radiation resistance-associated gene protein n=1 Tax=Diploscapter pachys TaxID=2018661 RepID=A0A2A2LBG2_9BILA|nr:hypothetical protein WR25_12350 [Diploscapter pachys]
MTSFGVVGLKLNWESEPQDREWDKSDNSNCSNTNATTRSNEEGEDRIEPVVMQSEVPATKHQQHVVSNHSQTTTKMRNLPDGNTPGRLVDADDINLRVKEAAQSFYDFKANAFIEFLCEHKQSFVFAPPAAIRREKGGRVRTQLMEQSILLDIFQNHAQFEVFLRFVILWFSRLRVVYQTSSDRMRQLEEYKASLTEDPTLASCLQAQQILSEVSNWSIRVESKRKKVNELRRMCAKKRMIISDINKRIQDKEERFAKITSYTDVGAEYLSDLREAKAERSNYLNIYSKLCIARRRSLIGEVAGIFRIKLRTSCDTDPSTSKCLPCTCQIYDTIRGAHLPDTNRLQNHNEDQLAAALGFVCHLLSVISLVIDYPFRYSLRPGGSTSHIFSPCSQKALPLFGMRKKVDKERLNEAVTLLTRDIIQLREDSGMQSGAMNRTLFLINEWICAANGGSIILWYPRPFNSILSPASLILIDESLETVDSELSVLRREDELAQQRLQKERQAEKEKIEAEQAKEEAVEVAAVRLREVIHEPPDINRILLKEAKRRKSSEIRQLQSTELVADSKEQNNCKNGTI